jgi:hypothetical protein
MPASLLVASLNREGLHTRTGTGTRTRAHTRSGLRSRCCPQGIEPLGNHSWVLLDGTFLGNNTISNANPYKHW